MICRSFQDGGVGILAAHFARHFANGAGPMRPEHTQDGQLGVGRLLAGTCNHARIIYEGLRRCQYEDFRSAVESVARWLENT